MSEYTLLSHCSPTLAGLKTGSVVTCSFSTMDEVREDLRRWNRSLKSKGIRIIPLKYMDGRVLLYIYRPRRLRKDLGSEAGRSILKRCGYGEANENLCICTLIRHLRSESEFPHEIGLFLGYPPEDVAGFMADKKAYKYAGQWKVYGDVEYTRKLFETYRRCTECYKRQSRKGRTLAELAVS